MPNSPSPFTAYTKQIKEMIVVDPLHDPLQDRDAVSADAVRHDAGRDHLQGSRPRRSTDDFNTGKAAIGTGPYKLVRYAKGDRIELARNDAYWGGKTPWEKVTLRLLPQDASRVAALLSGDVQVIEDVPTADVAQPAQATSASASTAPSPTASSTCTWTATATCRRSSPTRPASRWTKNPLKDPRVRKAISKAINRPAIVEKVMEGEAMPSGQLVPEFLFGATKNLKVETFDPEGAKKLLAEAGYPDGFGLTIHAPNNRYVNDAKIAQTVAQMLTRVGIDTKVVAMPSATYFTQATDLKFSFMLLGWSTGTGEASSSLKALLMTLQQGQGLRHRQPRPLLERQGRRADRGRAADRRRRRSARRYLQRATELAISDTGIVPLHFQVNLWATRDGITYVPRTDENTLAWKFRPRSK